MPYINPDKYSETSAFELLTAAAEGFIGVDRRLIHALVDDPVRTLPDILRFAAEPDPGAELQADLVAIFRFLRTPETAPSYARLVRELHDPVPDDLTTAVAELGAPMLEPLLELYEEFGEEDGGDVAFLLATLGVRDPRILDLLIERLEYEASDGALSLGIYGDAAAIPHLERMLAEIPESDPNLRHELETAIADIQSWRRDAVEPPSAEALFELYPPAVPPDFRRLSDEQRLSLLSDTPPEVRAAAAYSFRNDELERPLRDRLAHAAHNDPDPNVRGRAWESLSNESGEADIRRAMFGAARNGPLEERTGAVVALAAGPEQDDEVHGLVQSLYDNEPTARAKAIEAMWKTLDRRYQKYMVQHLDDPDPDVRHHAIYGVGYLGAGSQAERLIELFQDEDFRQDALLAYALSVPTEVTRSRMKPLFRRIDQLAGLSEPESELVEDALDQRLLMHGLKPVFEVEEGAEEEPAATAVPKAGRNDPCPCGSGKKYKKCHGA